jgi:FMN phosphatase YigB (HAD superfamily)
MSTAILQPEPAPTIEAVLFGLDGVLTDTASLHESAWRMVFDEVFARYPDARPFIHPDYLRYVDDLRRPGGLEIVLVSRGINIPAGHADDPPDAETLAALARVKLIGYRVRRLPAARRLAVESGYRGALFPWQSGSDGREETPMWIFDGVSPSGPADRCCPTLRLPNHHPGMAAHRRS